MFGMCKTKRSSKCKRCLFIISNIDIIWSIRTPPEFNYQLWTSYKIFLSLKYLFHFFLTSADCTFLINTEEWPPIHVGMDEMYEMDWTYQKFYTQLTEELTVSFFLC